MRYCPALADLTKYLFREAMCKTARLVCRNLSGLHVRAAEVPIASGRLPAFSLVTFAVYLGPPVHAIA